MAKFSDNSLAGIVWDDFQVALGTLNAITAITGNSKIDAARLQGFRVLRSEWYCTLSGLTAGEGPVLVGMAHDLTATEIKECIEADPQRSGDPGEEEKSKRAVWPLALMMNLSNDGMLNAEGVKKLGWSFPEGTILKYWAYNVASGDLTTGAVWFLLVKHFGVWLKD